MNEVERLRAELVKVTEENERRKVAMERARRLVAATGLSNDEVRPILDALNF